MNIKGNTILITGGATGIGFALAEAFVKAGNRMIICGRRKNKLNEAKEKLPQIYTRVCDVTKETERKALAQWCAENFKDLNVFINNAGIQKMIDFTSGAAGLFSPGDEIETNLAAPVYLSAHFIPLLLHQKEAAIVNVSSGLGFVPLATMPVYCATKAAMHLFSVSLRYQLKGTPVKVFEVIPPAVDTELGRGEGEEETAYPGIKPSVVAEAALAAMAKNEYEIAIGEAKGLVEGSRTNFKKVFESINRW